MNVTININVKNMIIMYIKVIKIINVNNNINEIQKNYKNLFTENQIINIQFIFVLKNI